MADVVNLGLCYRRSDQCSVGLLFARASDRTAANCGISFNSTSRRSTSLSDKPVSSAMSASGRPSAKPSRTVVLSHASISPKETSYPLVNILDELVRPVERRIGVDHAVSLAS